MANYPALPGLSSLKIKSDETNLFCLKLQKKAELGTTFYSLLKKENAVNFMLYF